MPPERSQEELETRHEQVSFLHIGISTSNRRERNYWFAIFQCLKRKQEVCIIYIYIIWVASTEIWRFFWSWCLHQPSNVLVLCILNIFANMFQNRNQGFTYTACSARHLHIGNLWMNLLPSIQLVGKAGGIFTWQQGTARAGRTWCQACGTSHRNSVLAERSLTSRERSHIPPWQKDCKNWTQKCFGHVGMLPELVAVTTLTVTSLRRDPEINLHLPQLHPGWGFPS